MKLLTGHKKASLPVLVRCILSQVRMTRTRSQELVQHEGQQVLESRVRSPVTGRSRGVGRGRRRGRGVSRGRHKIGLCSHVLMALDRTMRSTCQRHAYRHFLVAQETTKTPLASASCGTRWAHNLWSAWDRPISQTPRRSCGSALDPRFWVGNSSARKVQTGTRCRGDRAGTARTADET